MKISSSKRKSQIQVLLRYLAKDGLVHVQGLTRCALWRRAISEAMLGFQLSARL